MNVDTGKLSELLKKLAAGGNASTLARDMGVNCQTLRTYLRRDVKCPTIEFLGSVASYMGIPMESLLEKISDDVVVKYVHRESAFYFSADDAFPHLEKMPPMEKIEIARRLLNSAAADMVRSSEAD